MAELVRVRGCDNTNRRCDIIFVHGLNGNPREYWFPSGEPDKYWPAWVGEALPDCGVWSLGYENAALKPRRFSLAALLLQRGFAMPLMDRANNVLLRLKSEGIGERPLVFITHSMGGLLAKQLLHTANESFDDGWRKILEQTRGICFIATPHIGADAAKWVTYFRSFVGSNVSIDDLRPHEQNLRGMSIWYRNFVSKHGTYISTLSFYEMKPLLPFGKLVVEPGDADPGVPGAGVHPLDETHVSICKPREKSSQIHVSVISFVKQAIEKPRLRSDGHHFDAEITIDSMILEVEGNNSCPTETVRSLLRLVIVDGMRPADASEKLGLSMTDKRKLWMCGTSQLKTRLAKHITKLETYCEHLKRYRSLVP